MFGNRLRSLRRQSKKRRHSTFEPLEERRLLSINSISPSVFGRELPASVVEGRDVVVSQPADVLVGIDQEVDASTVQTAEDVQAVIIETTDALLDAASADIQTLPVAYDLSPTVEVSTAEGDFTLFVNGRPSDEEVEEAVHDWVAGQGISTEGLTIEHGHTLSYSGNDTLIDPLLSVIESSDHATVEQYATRAEFLEALNDQDVLVIDQVGGTSFVGPVLKAGKWAIREQLGIQQKSFAGARTPEWVIKLIQAATAKSGGPVQSLTADYLTGPASGVRGQPLNFTLHAPTAAPDQYTFNIDWDGDNNVDQSLNGVDGQVIEHIFPWQSNVLDPSLSHDIHVTVTNGSGVNESSSHSIHVKVAELQTDPVNSNLQNLVFGGTPNDDHYGFFQTSDPNIVAIQIWINNVDAGFPISGVTGRVITYGQGGNDEITAPLLLHKKLEAYAGAGHDTVSSGPNDDSLFGGDGDDVLVGAVGADSLWGEAGNDILSGGLNDSNDEQDDHLLGGDGDDSLLGEGGDDTLEGGNGADLLGVDAGDDLLIGGEGSDGYIFIGTGLGHDVVVEVTTPPSTEEFFDYFDFSGYGEAVTLDLALSTEQSLTPGSSTPSYVRISDPSGSTTGEAIVVEAAQGSPLNDTIYGNSVRNFLLGGLGNDTIDGRDGDDIIIGTGIDPEGEEISFLEGDGDDSLLGGDGDDTVFGMEGDDTIDGGGGHDTLVGGFGDSDEGGGVFGSDGNDSILGGAGDDRIFGTQGSDTLKGGSGGDTIFGWWLEGSSPEDGNDSIFGDEGDDTLIGGDKDDELDGGDGYDFASYVYATDSVTVDLDAGIGHGPGDDEDSLVAIENVTGSPYGDWLIGDAGANVIEGGGGDDSIEGNAGDDSLLGNSGTDTVFGGDGDDIVFGGSSNTAEIDAGDLLYGDAGDDAVIGGYGEDTLFGGAGEDGLAGGNLDFDEELELPPTPDFARDELHGGDDNDFVIGSEGDDELYGDAGNDVVIGWWIFGEAEYITDDDIMYGGDGDDIVAGLYGSDTAHGGEGNDTLAGDGMEDMLLGNGNDALFGEDGDDSLLGYDGDDTLEGGNDDDDLVGGQGNDVYRFTGQAAGHDVLTELTGGGSDWLDFSDATTAVMISLDTNGTQQWGGGSLTPPDYWSDLENVMGSAQDDLIFGNSADNLFLGLGGDDSLAGLGGDDFLFGDAGLDMLAGGTGRDVLVGGNDADALSGGDHDDILIAGSLPNVRADQSIIALNSATDTIRQAWTANLPMLERFANLAASVAASSPLPLPQALTPGESVVDDNGADYHMDLLDPGDGDDLVYFRSQLDQLNLPDSENDHFIELDPALKPLDVTLDNGVLRVTYSGNDDLTYSVVDGYLLINGDNPLPEPVLIATLSRVDTEMGVLSGALQQQTLFDHNLPLVSYSQGESYSAPAYSAGQVSQILSTLFGNDWTAYVPYSAQDLSTMMSNGHFDALLAIVRAAKQKGIASFDWATCTPWYLIHDSLWQTEPQLAAQANIQPAPTHSFKIVTPPTPDPVNEGPNASVTFKLEIDAAGLFDFFTLTVKTTDGTAHSGSDYIGISMENEMFSPWHNNRGKSYTITILDDTIPEAPETFLFAWSNHTITMDLANVLPLMQGNSTATATINDNDGAPPEPDASISPSSQGLVEGETLTFTVALTGPYNQPVTVNWMTMPTGSDPAESADLSPSWPSGQLIFQAGETTKTFDVFLSDDDELEQTETFKTVISEGANIDEIIISTSNNWIEDNEQQRFEISIDDPAPVVEGDDPSENRIVKFTVSLDRAPTETETVTVNFATADGFGTANGSAKSGSDYIGKTESITWQVGQPLAKDVVIEIIEDTREENPPLEDFFGLLSGASTNALIRKSKGTAQIRDDDGFYKGPTGGDDQPTPHQEPDCPECGPDQIYPSLTDGNSGVGHGFGGPHDSNAPSTNYSGVHNPHPIIKADVVAPTLTDSSKVLVTAKVELTLTFNDISVGTTYAPAYYSSSTGLIQGSPLRFAMQVDASNLNTGTYKWSMKVTYDFAKSSGGTFTDYETTVRTYGGIQSIINRTTSEYGRGWWLDGLDQIIEQTDGVTLVLGSGYASFFKKNANGTYATPGAYFSTLTFDGNYYTLTDSTGATDKFKKVFLDSVCRLEQRRDRLGNLTTYEYSANFLRYITEPNGNVWTFWYDGNNKVTTVTDPASRVTNVSIVDGKLTSITSPDPDGIPGNGVNPLTTTYSYNAQNRLSEIQQVSGEITEFFYDSNSGRLDYLEHEDGERQYVDPYQTVGLPNYSAGQGTTAANPAPFVSPNDVVATTTNEENETKSVKMDRFGYPIYEKDHLGNVTQFERFSNGRLKKVTYPDPDDYTATGGVNGPRLPLVVEYTWDAKGNMLSRTENVTAKETWTYDLIYSQVTSYTDQLNRRTEYTIDPTTGNVTQVRRVMGTIPTVDDLITSYTYTDAADNVPKGMIETITDPENRVTRYEYYTDSSRKGLLKKVTFAENTVDQADLEYDYDLFTRDLISSKDELDRVTTYEYDALYRLKKLIEPDPDGSGPLTSPVWEYTYCNCGNIDTIKDPEGNITDYEFDDRNLLWKIILPEPFAGSGHPTIEYQYDDAERLASVTMPDPDGPSQPKLPAVTSYTYDDRGLLIQVTLPDPDGPGNPLPRPTWDYGYDRTGLLVSQKDPKQFETNFEFDTRMRLTKVIEPAPHVGDPRPTWRYIPDAAGQVVLVLDPRLALTSYAYDRAGRLVSVTEPDPDGAAKPQLSPITHYLYDKAGNLRYEKHWTGATNFAKEITTERQYDYRDRLKVLIEPDRDGSPGGAIGAPQTSFSYDAGGNLKTLTDPSSNVTTWQYDNLDRVIQETNQLNKSRFYSYDSVGNVTQMTDRNGRVINYLYDDLYRLGLETETGSPSIVYGYDLADRLVFAGASGSSYTYEFDDLGRNTETRTTVSGGPQVKLNAVYDENSRRSSLSALLGSTSDFLNNYEYDRLNRMTAVRQSGLAGGNAVAEKRVSMAYDLAGNPTVLNRYRDLAGTQTVALSTYATDLAGNRTVIAHQPLAAGAARITNTAAYDRLHRVTSYTHSADGLNSYTLDNLGQVIASVTPPAFADESYSFDDAGNRKTDGGTSYIVTANNRLASDGVDSYLYDGEGNRTRKTHFVNATTTIHTNYTYDRRNRLTSVVERLNDPVNGAIQKHIQYTYDAFNRRASRQTLNSAGVVTRSERFVYDGDRVVMDFVDPDGAAGAAPLALSKRYLHGPAVDQILAQENLDQALSGENRVYWFLEDHQQTTRDLVNNAGKLVTHYVYDAFGEVVSGDTSKTRYLYTGRELDPATGLQYNWHRWYDPHTGRWVSEDPIGFEGGDYNFTRYSGNQATTYSDPTGLVVWNASPQPSSPAPVDQSQGTTWEPSTLPPRLYDPSLPQIVQGLPTGPPGGGPGPMHSGIGPIELRPVLTPWDTPDVSDLMNPIGPLGGVIKGGGGLLRRGGGKLFGPASGRMIPGVGGRFHDAASCVNLRKLTLNQGTTALEKAGLKRVPAGGGKYNFVDSSGNVRARYCPKSGQEPPHWNKFEPSGNQKHYLNSSGHPVTGSDPSHRMPTR